jgi:hypothetical protein
VFLLSLHFLSETFLIPRRIQPDTVSIHTGRSSREVPVILVRFKRNFNLLDRLSKNTQTPNLMKIRHVRAELSHADGRADFMQLSLFAIFAKTPKN